MPLPALVFLALVLLVTPASARAQTPAEIDENPARVGVLTRAALHLTAEHLSGSDPRFVWDANFGGELDLVDYGSGRLTFLANYQVILGEELRAFDPNQGNYILAGSVSRRLSRLELAGVFHHESRHLSDREKRDPVDWNMVGGRVRADLSAADTSLLVRADVRGVVQKSFVDYRWEIDGGIRAQHPLRSRFAAIGGGGLRLLGVDGTRNRGTQTGFRGEGGVRLDGPGGAVELFVALERRIDPDPLQFGTRRWLTAGFRLLTR